MNHTSDYKAIMEHLLEVHKYLNALLGETQGSANADEREFVAQALRDFYPLFYGVQDAESAHDSFAPTARG